jgi:hypothetical protein
MTDNELLIQYLLTKRKLKQLSQYNDSCFSLVQIFLERHLVLYEQEILNRRTNSNNIDIHKYSHEVFNERKYRIH